MRNKLSVFALFTRSNLYRILSLFALMAVVQTILFCLTMKSPLLHTLELIGAVEYSRLSLIFGAVFLLMTAQLCMTGCEFGSHPGYILRRLSVSPRMIFILQAISNTGFYLLLIATQALILYGLSAYFPLLADPATVNHQSVYLSFYRSDFMHSILPLDEVSLYVRNLILALGMGIATASVPHYQRRRRVPIVIFIIAAVTLGFFVQELGNTAANTVVSLFVLVFAGSTVYNIMTGGDSVET